MKRVLIVRIGAMGDVLHALPAVAALHRAAPEWVVDWLVDERWQPLLSGDAAQSCEVRRSFPVPTRAWKRRPLAPSTMASFFAFAKLRGEYDRVVDMQGTVRSSSLGWLAGRGRLCGYDDPRERFAAALYAKRFGRVGAHVVEQGAALLSAACGLALEPQMPQIPHTAWADAWAAELVGARRVAVLTPRAGWQSKQWPMERFAELAVRLHDKGYRCMVNMAQKDDALAAEVVARSQGAAEPVVCNVAGLVALVRRAALLVGGDSGPMHLAAMLGVPVVALFGPTNPERNGPWGPGPKAVLRHRASKNTYKRVGPVDPGLAEITVDEVLRAVANLGETPRV